MDIAWDTEQALGNHSYASKLVGPMLAELRPWGERVGKLVKQHFVDFLMGHMLEDNLTHYDCFIFRVTVRYFCGLLVEEESPSPFSESVRGQ